MRNNIKQSLHWLGRILAISGIVFVILRLIEYSSQLDISHLDKTAWAIISAAALVYAFANILLALAWWNLLVYFGTTTSLLWAIRTYGITQLAKYVPGNIMHLASRQVLGLADGVPGWHLAKASAWELGLISVAGALFSILVLPQFSAKATTHTATVGFIFTLLIMALLLKRYANKSVAKAFGWYVVFLTTSGILFVGLLTLISSAIIVSPSHVITYCGAFVIAWLIGLITPGAPAGAGVRELVLILLLKNFVVESDLLLAILLSRVVTVFGDVLFYLFASLLKRSHLPS